MEKLISSFRRTIDNSPRARNFAFTRRVEIIRLIFFPRNCAIRWMIGYFEMAFEWAHVTTYRCQKGPDEWLTDWERRKRERENVRRSIIHNAFSRIISATPPVVKFERNRIIRESGNRLTILTKNFDDGNKNGIEFFPFFNFLSVWFIYWILLLSILSGLYYYSFILFTLLFIYYFVSVIAKNRTELNNEGICLIMLRLYGFL